MKKSNVILLVIGGIVAFFVMQKSNAAPKNPIGGNVGSSGGGNMLSDLSTLFGDATDMYNTFSNQNNNSDQNGDSTMFDNF